MSKPTLRLVRNTEWGEYIVQWREGGKLNEKKSYYSGGLSKDHKEDATRTMRNMQARIDADAPGYRARKVTTKTTKKRRR